MKPANLILSALSALIATSAAALIARPAGAQEGGAAAVKAGEEYIRKYDVKKKGYLVFDDLKDAELFKKLDKNGDGRITTADFLAKPPGAAEDRMMMMMKEDAKKLYKYEGFHALVLYDKNHDGYLDEEELKYLLIAAMDQDEDHVLNANEIKHAKNPPGLILDEGWFVKEAKAMDTNGDGVITPAEMRVPEVYMRLIDKNKDGRISLEEMARAQVVNVLGGYIPKFQEMSDLVGKAMKIDRANWLGDPEMFRRLDEDKDGVISTAEFDRYARNLRNALSLCNDFIVRNDLDGDGKVSRREFPGTDSMFQRMDKNHDGFITAADRSPPDR